MNPAKHPWRSALVAAALLQLLPATLARAEHHRADGDKPDLVATAQAAGSFKTLATALKAADLVAEENRRVVSSKAVSARPGRGNPPKPPHALQPSPGNRLLHLPAGCRRGGTGRGAAPGGRVGDA